MISRIFFLVDTGNCKFLLIEKENEWNLPVLENIEDSNKLKFEFEDKYKIKIKNLEVIEEKEEYLLVKCFLTEKIEETRYMSAVINDIYSIVNDKYQKQILFDISKQIYMEILNDSFWLGIILTIEDRIKDEGYKYILSDFLLFFSSIFCTETVNYKYGAIKDKEYISGSEIKKLRKAYLKECPLYNSKDIKKIVEEMGIQFDIYVFDIVIFFLSNNLVDINSRMWNKKNLEVYNAIVMSPRNWIKNILPDKLELFEQLREPYIESFLTRFTKEKINRKSYSTYKLFDNKLTYDEKVYILQRIGLLKTILMISNKFGNGNYITINEKENINLNFDRFLIKAKATIIELIWNDNKNNHIPILRDILSGLPKEIDEKFYKINRKCRDNIHYGFFNIIKNDEFEELIKYQDIYLNYVVKELERNLKIKFGFGYRIALNIAKLQYWANN